MSRLSLEPIEQPNGCWYLPHRPYKSGYVYFRWNGKQVRAHRYFWEKANGPIPQGNHICHHCDNPRCVNPDHLFLGDALSNAQDAVRKGRTEGRKQKLLGNHNGAALSSQEVGLVRWMLHCGIWGAECARIYQVSPKTIWRIEHHRTWKELSDAH